MNVHFFQILADLVGVGYLLVHVGRDLDHPAPLGPLYGGVALHHVHLGHLAEGHLLARRGADAHSFYVA